MSNAEEVLLHHDDEGRLTLVSLQAGVISARLTGHTDKRAVDLFLAALEKAFARGARGLFVDMFDLQDYAPELRSRAIVLVSKHLRQLQAIHVGVTSPVVRMGVTVASLAIRNIQSHTKRESYALELRRAIEDRGPTLSP